MSETAVEESAEPQDGAAYFGNEVRHAREFAGMTQEQLAEATHYKRPYVSKVESGALLASQQFADACDRVFGTPGSFGRLRRRVSERGHPGWFIPYVKLEQTATTISDYSNAFIMGMLQTPAYAKAVFRAMHPRAADATINGWVEARLQRRDVMNREAPPLLWVIFHEGVLRTAVGGNEVMAEQRNHLVSVAESPHIMIQVLPFRAGAPASHVPFILLTQEDGAPVMYSETTGRGHVTDSATAVANAQSTYDRLRAAALSPDDSAAFIRKITEDHAT
ncbi:helix-turn-helix domain-containing protein [Streptomyces liangshanensis]|uniref:Helix-turn-helix domain-containing protein n=1 Tax=Streptomyces liangshanensis TaxID=2717324 RepID=A0A6G9H1E6_9ACTN|nr:helix-turn-helix transcriptional regulator [Streptomyces liangshanensis]QIQ04353.1 helix-turn-helix domain-containing protein [Streptomyces liangshanensis]